MIATHTIRAPYTLHGHKNVAGMAMADEAAAAICAQGISTDRAAVESLLATYPDAELYGLNIEAEQVIMLMNPHTGTVMTAEDWAVEGYDKSNAELVEVVKDDAGDWVEA